MSPDPSAALRSPVTTRRIVGFDVARAFAILGMIVVNYRIALMGFGGGDENGLVIWLAGACTGRASALFVVLAGVGVSLLTADALANDRAAEARLRLVRRAVFLFALGLVFQIYWEGDILHYYGVYLLLGAAALTLPGVLLWLLAAVFAALFVGLFQWLDYDTGWRWMTLSYPSFWRGDGFPRNLFFNGFHPVVPWTSFLFVGMALGRIDWSTRRARLLLVAGGGGAYVAARLASAWLGELAETLDDATERRFLDAIAGTSSMPPMPLYVLQASGMAGIVIGVCLELGFVVGRRVLWPLVATGQLALTFYIAHVVLGLWTLEEIWPERDRTVEGTVVASAATFGIFAVFASIWRWFLRRGPLEHVMRVIAP